MRRDISRSFLLLATRARRGERLEWRRWGTAAQDTLAFAPELSPEGRRDPARLRAASRRCARVQRQSTKRIRAGWDAGSCLRRCRRVSTIVAALLRDPQGGIVRPAIRPPTTNLPPASRPALFLW